MRTADWSELDPDATYYGWHDSRHGEVVVGADELDEARALANLNNGDVAALLDNEVVRVPDGDPPAEPSLVELQRVSDEAELAWVVASQPHARLNSEADIYYRARIALLRARLAEGEKP